MSYSNPGNADCGYLIEKTTGKPFDQYIRETFLRPMGMEHADYPFTEQIRLLLATAYEGSPPKPSGYPFIYLRPAGDLKASPREWRSSCNSSTPRQGVGDTQLVNTDPSCAWKRRKPRWPRKMAFGWAYGLCNIRASKRVVTHGHDGGIDGFISSYRYCRTELGLRILLNSDNPSKRSRA